MDRSVARGTVTFVNSPLSLRRDSELSRASYFCDFCSFLLPVVLSANFQTDNNSQQKNIRWDVTLDVSNVPRRTPAQKLPNVTDVTA